MSARELAILAEIERDLDRSAPARPRAMARPVAARLTAPLVFLYACFALLGLVLVLAVAGTIPAPLWGLIAVLTSMVLVPWALLRLFERFDRDPE